MAQPRCLFANPFPLLFIKQRWGGSLVWSGSAIALTLLSGCSLRHSQAARPNLVKADGVGVLEVRANGEDFVRSGFTSKDGWEISFEHVYVNLTAIEALQTSPPFDPDGEALPQVVEQQQLYSPRVVDLAAEEASMPLVASFSEAKAGRYNALAWSMVPGQAEPMLGKSLQLVGQAQKAGEQVDFRLDWDQSYRYVCGDFIGDQRKGILKAGDRAELEATFHFDHLFGDGEQPPTDEINQGALGFEPLVQAAASLESGNSPSGIHLTPAQLKVQLESEDWQRLETAMAGLAHVGEGHCQEVEL